MYLHSLHLRDFRAFSDSKIEFCVPDTPATADLRLPNLTVLLGDNGSGKTSLLRAICIAIFGDTLRDMSDWRSLHNVQVRPDGSVADFAWLRGLATLRSAAEPPQPVGCRIHPVDEYIEKVEGMGGNSLGTISGLGLAAYGSQRQVGSGSDYKSDRHRSKMHPLYRPVSSLMSPTTSTLTPLAAWVPHSNQANRMLRIVETLLPTGVSFTTDVRQGELEVDFKGRRLPFTSLSDGFRAHIGWVSDLLYHLLDWRFRGEQPAGLVLVDEIDLHLHPSWQQQVLPRLCRAFPAVQFVVTTHSPILVGSVESKNLRILRQTKEGRTRISTAKSEVWGLTADQVLMSPVFGLHHTRNQDFVTELKAVEARAISGDPEASFQYEQMLAHGGAAPSSFDEDELPQWIKDVSAKRESPSDRP